MADKIDSLTLPNSGGTTTTYDIDLPPDATPSIASLTISGNNNEYIKTTGQSGFYKADGTIATPSNQKIKVGSVTFGAGDEIDFVNGGNMNIAASTSGTGAPKITFTASNTNYYPTAFTWTDGTSAGPTATITMSGTSNISVNAIPSATESVSGIVTTSAQTFGGKKTFKNDGGIDIRQTNATASDSGKNTLSLTYNKISNYGSNLSGGVEVVFPSDVAASTTYTLTLPKKTDTIATLGDITDTWRTIQVNNADILGSGTGTGKLNLIAGSNVTLTNSGGNVTIQASGGTDTNYYHTPSYSTGLKIGTGVGVNDLYVPDAGQNQSGVVNTSSQGFYGPKTFHSSITVNSSISAGGTIESNSSVNSWGPNEDAPTDSSVVDWENHSFLGKFWNNCISCINDDTGDEYIYAFPNKSGVINFGTEIVDLRNINE